VIAVRNGKVFLDSLLSLVDVEQIVRIVVSVCDPSKDTPLADRKRMLLAGVKTMIDADVHLIFKHVEWLHRHGTNESAGKLSSQLAPRQRQVFVHLLRGASKSEIAEKLSLSFHTVNDYTKAIYKHFAVNSKGELQAQFSIGQQLNLYEI